MKIKTGEIIGMNREREIIQSASYGYAYHKIICDENGYPADFEVIDFNPAFQKMTSLQTHEITGKTISNVLPPLQESEFDWTIICKEIVLKGSKKEFEHYFASLKKWYNVQVYSVEKSHVVTVFSDITSLKRTEENLRKSEKKYKSLFEQSNDAIFMHDF